METFMGTPRSQTGQGHPGQQAGKEDGYPGGQGKLPTLVRVNEESRSYALPRTGLR
jgi:hypothetical protein